jgi:hypothetical protein
MPVAAAPPGYVLRVYFSLVNFCRPFYQALGTAQADSTTDLKVAAPDVALP